MTKVVRHTDSGNEHGPVDAHEVEKLRDAVESLANALNRPLEPVEGVLSGFDFNTIREHQLIQTTLLMRQYDILMGILASLDQGLADRIYDSHDKGGLFNPKLLVPEFGPAQEVPGDE